MKHKFFFIATLVLLLPPLVVYSYDPIYDDCCVNQVQLPTYVLASDSYINLNVSEAKHMIETNSNLVILDVRTQEEYDEGHIENAILIPVSELEGRLDELDSEKDTLVYCRSGGRSATASQILVDNGFTSVYNMLGGITTWINEGYIVYVKYSSIQEAINNAEEGDTIYISSGTYHENVIINNAITLIGENKRNTIIDGDNTGKVVQITVNDTEIRRFTIQKAGFIPWGSDSGIYVTSSSNLIADNFIVDNDDWAIWLDSSSRNNTITRNEIADNWRGCMFKDTSGNTLAENNITNHGQDGICLWNSSQNLVTDNNISINVDGVVLTSSHNNNITGNSITNNLHGVSVDSSLNNRFCHNNFINNNQQVFLFTFVGTNLWDDDYPSGGNYWNDYSGADNFSGSLQNITGSDRIGDEPYIIDADNIDRYPLMNPWIIELLKTDLNNDGTINILDISIVALAFGSTPEDPDWNEMADLNNDEIVNILDISTVAVDFGKNVESAALFCTYSVVNVYPHDPDAFTQGLAFENGTLYESTGLYGNSTLRQVELETGEIKQLIPLPDQFFGEGITIFDDKIIQLTWRSNTGFVYDKHSFELLQEFYYPTEGWGITHNVSLLIMSDGTATLFFLDPETFEVVRQVEVHYDDEPVTRLNELEYIQGDIYANIWKDERIAIINPQTGQVKGWIDLSPIANSEDGDVDNVLNGIAYDAEEDRLFITGKRWAHLYEIELITT